MADLTETKSEDEMHILNNSKMFKDKNRPHVFHHYLRDLSLRKGIAPFDKMTHGKYLLRKTLPPKSHFESSLTLEEVSDVDYRHAQRFYKEFHCENLLMYLRLYCHISHRISIINILLGGNNCPRFSYHLVCEQQISK